MCAALAFVKYGDWVRAANWLALWGVIAVGTFFVQATVWTSAVASRFEASRGLAFAHHASSGASLAATVYPILATWLIGNYGWRTAYAAMGGLWVVVVFPVLFLLVSWCSRSRS